MESVDSICPASSPFPYQNKQLGILNYCCPKATNCREFFNSGAEIIFYHDEADIVGIRTKDKSVGTTFGPNIQNTTSAYYPVQFGEKIKKLTWIHLV